MICKYCGEEFQSQRKKMYCSISCSKKASNVRRGVTQKKYKKICPVCSEEFETVYTRKVFCSKKCGNKKRDNKRIYRGNIDWHYIESQRKMVEDGSGRFEYIESRRLEHNQQIKVKCTKCGSEQIRSASAIRRRGLTQCPICDEKKRIDSERLKVVNFLKALAEKKKDKVCPCCGKIFHSEYQNKVFCSKRCREKNHQRGRYKRRYAEGKIPPSNYRKRAKKYGCVYEQGITRLRVVKRDNYICAICGKVCNPKDKRWGTSGPDYPTLDHIIPLAKGGSHSWDNVQCACGECNSYKRDLII